MALHHANIYAIRNGLTHTVLDLSNIRGLFGMSTLSPLTFSTMLTRTSLVKGCGWHGGPNQQVGDGAFSTGLHANALYSGKLSRWAAGGNLGTCLRTSIIHVASFILNRQTDRPMEIFALPVG